MFRIKVASILAVVFLMTGIAVYLNMSNSINENTVRDQEAHTKRARDAVVQGRALRDYAIIAKAEDMAHWPQLGTVLSATRESMSPQASPLDEGADGVDSPAPVLIDESKFAYRVHQKTYEEILVWKAKFESKAQPKGPAKQSDFVSEAPNLLIVVDPSGNVVADLNDPARFGPSESLVKKFPALKAALGPRGRLRDVWTVRGSPMSVGAAPVVKDGKVLGAVVVGFRLTTAESEAASSQVNAGVAFMVDGQVRQSSSFEADAEPAIQKAMLASFKVRPNASSGTFEVELGRRLHFGSWVRVEGYDSAEMVVAALRDVDGALARARSSILVIPITLILGLLLSLSLILYVFNAFVAPFKEVEQGVLEIINGNLDYWFEAEEGDATRHLAQNLNIMVCQLSGRPLPDEDDVVSAESWAVDQMFIDVIEAADAKSFGLSASVVERDSLSTLPASMVRLIRDDDDAYHRQTFSDYVEALKQTGEPVAGITYGSFVEELQKNSDTLKPKYECERVRFLVEVEGGRATLKPVPLG